jgi:hypothetical protein
VEGRKGTNTQVIHQGGEMKEQGFCGGGQWERVVDVKPDRDSSRGKEEK